MKEAQVNATAKYHHVVLKCSLKKKCQ